VLPDIPGLAERWGVDVLHCAYCHGWEVQDQAIGVLVTNGMATHQALLFRQLSDRISLLQHTGPTPTEDELEQLAARGVEIVPGEVIEVLASASGLTGVRLDDGTVVGLDAVVVSPRAASRSTMLEPLGLVPTEFLVGETVLGDQIEADPTGATAVPGVYVAGNVASVPAQVVSSAAAGLMVGAAINADLVAEEVSEAVSSARDATAAAVPAR
jgi:thioredoxin reductase